VSKDNVEEAIAKHEQLVDNIKPGKWYKFCKGRVNKDKLTSEVFISFNISSSSDSFKDALRKSNSFRKHSVQEIEIHDFLLE
jgi:hypothetical protein